MPLPNSNYAPHNKPYTSFVAVAGASASDFATGTARAVIVGTGGTFTVLGAENATGDTPVQITLPAGLWPVALRRITAIGTAAGLVLCY